VIPLPADVLQSVDDWAYDLMVDLEAPVLVAAARVLDFIGST
jgi:hypothetical protein